MFLELRRLLLLIQVCLNNLSDLCLGDPRPAFRSSSVPICSFIALPCTYWRRADLRTIELNDTREFPTKAE
jgi:hypothetical protein